MISVNEFLLLMFPVSIGAGIVGALVGVGGGMFIVPALTLGFGIPLQYAIGASIIAIIATSNSSAAAYVKDRITNLRVGMFLEIGTTVGAIVGALTALYLIGSNLQSVIFVIFGLLLLFNAYNVYMRGRTERLVGIAAAASTAPNHTAEALKLSGEYYDGVLKQSIPYMATRIPAGFVIMFFAGVASALLGVGGGVLKVIGMDSMMKLPFKVSTTTSNFMIGVTAAASAGIYYFGGFVNPIIAAPVAIGVVIGAYVGTKILVRSTPSSIRLVFMGVVVLVALEMIKNGVFGS